MIKKHNSIIYKTCLLSIIVLLLTVSFDSVSGFSGRENIIPIRNASLKDNSRISIRMDGFWSKLLGKKDPTPTPTPTLMPSSTPTPEQTTSLPYFWKHTLIIKVGEKVTLGYRLNDLESPDITVISNGEINAVKKRDSNNIEITAVKVGESEIKMKDPAGEVVDTCLVIVYSAYSPSFWDHQISINVGHSFLLKYGLNDHNNIHFTVRPSGIIKAEKKRDGVTLEIIGSVPGVSEILMKDDQGNIVDICYVVVRPQTPLMIFSDNTITAYIGEKTTLNYGFSNQTENLQFSVRPSGIVNVVKTKNSNSLKLTGLKLGEAEILMKDNDGFVIDICHITVKQASAKTPLPQAIEVLRKNPTPIKTPTPIKVTWNCYDNTTFNGDAYDDNICFSSLGEIRYASDSQAIALDPSYKPGKSGAYYYNNQ